MKLLKNPNRQVEKSEPAIIDAIWEIVPESARQILDPEKALEFELGFKHIFIAFFAGGFWGVILWELFKAWVSTWSF